jgi:hypothetical protein
VVPSKDPAAVSTVPTTNITKQKTPEEILKCKDEAKVNMLARRDFDYKDSVISGFVW